jgi:cobalt/nickel transport system ATP-binding protein
MTNGSPIIELRGITYAWPGRSPVLDQLDFTLNEGGRIGLIAPNGSGKTTLLHIITGLLAPDSGTIAIFGQPVEEEKDFQEVRRQVGLLFQDADDQLFSPTVLEDVAFGPLNLGKSRAEAIAVSRRILSFLGMDGFEDRITYQLSGGEKRMVALASVMAMEPRVLLLDEPSAGLDDAAKSHLTEVLKSLDISYFLVSHEFDFITEVTDTIFTIHHGGIHDDSQAVAHSHVHSHPYGRQHHEHDRGDHCHDEPHDGELPTNRK